MTMTDGEIVRSYQEAASPKKQIKILADLNDCTTEEIREVLKQFGYRFGRGGNPVQDTASPADLPDEEQAADTDGLPAKDTSLLGVLAKEINRAVDQMRAAEAERERLEAECARLRKICDALYVAHNALAEAYGK